MKRFSLLLSFLVLAGIVSAEYNLQQLGHLSYTDDLSDIWGWADGAGNEYALVGTYSELSIVDVTDPANPTEVFFGSGAPSIWRDIKTWDHYVYVSNEQGGGVYIADLSQLPGTITNTNNFTGSMYPFSSAHNVYVDETGKLYIFGSNNGNGGAIICDLTEDPMNPVELGRYNTYYLHDGMARGDTLWGAAIYAGHLLAIDVSDPSNPTVMGSVNSPGQFTHNCWVSDDGTHVFTTDEISSGFIGAFDVTDLSNIVETDQVQTAAGTGVIPHNTFVINDYLVTSYYTEGITIHDASYPDNIIETGHFDTSPNYSGNGYHGSWGTYPYLPSGIILASDIEEGLYTLQPTYIRAVHVKGLVTDSITGDPLFNVQYQVAGTEISGQTAFDGTFSFGTLQSGTFDIQFSLEGYNTKVIEGVEFVNGELINLEVMLSVPNPTGIKEKSNRAVFNTFPNPFTSGINIEYSTDGIQAQNVILQVFDITGKKVEENNLTGISGIIKLGEDLNPGVYFVKISGGNFDTCEMKRIVKL